MLGGFVLLPYEITHEVAQQLGTGAVTRFRGLGKFALQCVVDAEGKGGFTHFLAPRCVTWSVHRSTRLVKRSWRWMGGMG
ncbi:hypothetical protein [Pseudomonas sp. BAY1663]|uniref:hypothetical protein n=1 Tax=Pseudomonas sp. BAY1663 TaxID=1439940 RepID=UPI0004B428A1|nr:hypothetical protein [Pseudomonas sp. BAY1663]